MTEILRMRMARSPQRSVPGRRELVPSHLDEDEFVTLLQSVEDSDRIGEAQNRIAQGNMLSDPPSLSSPLIALDRALVAAGNRLSPEELVKHFPVDDNGRTDRRGPALNGNYGSDRQAIGDSLVAGILTGASPQHLVRLHRLLLVCGLLELLRDDPASVADGDAVFAALWWRVVVFPYWIFPEPAENLSRRVGFADLYVVHQDWVTCCGVS